MDADAPGHEPRRVLWVTPLTTLGRGNVQEIVAAGGEAIVVASAADARRALGAFDGAVFAFDLPDGSGIILAAEMLLENRVRAVSFVHPHDELTVPTTTPREGPVTA